MKKTPLYTMKGLDLLLEEALKNNGALTTPQELSSMLLNIKGVSINSKPRKDGRFQGYVKKEDVKYYVYGKSPNEVALKLRDLLTKELPKKEKKATPKGVVPTTFNEFAMYYFNNFRAKKVSEITFKVDIRRYKKYLQPYFGELPLKKITPLACQKLIEDLQNEGKGKTADELYSLLNVIFKMAIRHNLMVNNPLDIIVKERYERKHGSSLTKAEELRLKTALKGTKYESAFNLMLYTGLRPNELKTAQIQGDFIVAVNSKRKNKKVEYKKIPIIRALKPFLVDLKIPYLDLMRKTIKAILPSHILYDLRTTFYSRCKEYGVSQYALNEFMGHSNGELGNTYTDLSDDFLLAEGKKLDKWE